MKLKSMLLCLCGTVLACGLTTPAQAAGYSDLIVFGDSLTDSGNMAADEGVDAGQVITANDYYPWNPYAGGAYSNGPIWAEALALRMSLPALLPSSAGGGNFAYAFAKVLSPGSSKPYSLPTQVGQYLARQSASADPNALYVLAGGANDLFFARHTAAGTAAAASLNARFSKATGDMVDTLQAAGARHIVVWNVPNLALTPGLLSEGAAVSGNAALLAQGMNASLAQRLATEGPEVQVFDVYGLWAQWIAAGPGASGFENLSDACGAPSNQCDAKHALFWDAIHPTAAGHMAMAAALHAQVSPVPEPGSLSLLAAGLCWLLRQMQRGRKAGGPLALV